MKQRNYDLNFEILSKYDISDFSLQILIPKKKFSERIIILIPHFSKKLL